MKMPQASLDLFFYKSYWYSYENITHVTQNVELAFFTLSNEIIFYAYSEIFDQVTLSCGSFCVWSSQFQFKQEKTFQNNNPVS